LKKQNQGITLHVTDTRKSMALYDTGKTMHTAV